MEGGWIGRVRISATCDPLGFPHRPTPAFSDSSVNLSSPFLSSSFRVAIPKDAIYPSFRFVEKNMGELGAGLDGRVAFRGMFSDWGLELFFSPFALKYGGGAVCVCVCMYVGIHYFFQGIRNSVEERATVFSWLGGPRPPVP